MPAPTDGGSCACRLRDKVQLMNENISRQKHMRATQAAEGVPRWRWTTAELEKLDQLGAFPPEDKFELIGGEIVPLSARNRFHEVGADQLSRYWVKRLPRGIWLSGERQFNLDVDTYAYPDIILMPDSIKAYDQRPGRAARSGMRGFKPRLRPRSKSRDLRKVRRARILGDQRAIAYDDDSSRARPQRLRQNVRAAAGDRTPGPTAGAGTGRAAGRSRPRLTSDAAADDIRFPTR